MFLNRDTVTKTFSLSRNLSNRFVPSFTSSHSNVLKLSWFFIFIPKNGRGIQESPILKLFFRGGGLLLLLLLFNIQFYFRVPAIFPQVFHRDVG